MYGRDGRYQFRRNFLQGGIPATLTIIALSVVVWFLIQVTHNVALLDVLSFNSIQWPVPYIWTVATWPIVELDNPIFVLFALFWAYSIGGSLERSWGTRDYVVFWLATNALTAITLWLGGMVLHAQTGIAGLWLGLAAPTVAWCLVNRRETVMFSFVLPIPAVWLAWLSVVMVWYEVGPPIVGLFALSGCAAAYWYVTKVRGGSGGYSDSGNHFRVVRPEPRRRGESTPAGFSLSRYLRERRERRRLEDIFRRSGFDTDDEKRR